MSSHLLVPPAEGVLRRGWVTLASPAASWWWPLWTEEEQERFLVLQQQDQADEQTAAGAASLLVFETESAWQEAQAPLSAHVVDMFTDVEEVEGTDQRVQLVVKNPSGVALQFSAEEDGGVGDWLNTLALHIAGLRRQAQQRPPATPAPATPPRVVNLAHRAYNWLYPADTESVSSYSEDASDATPSDEAVTAVTNAEGEDGRDEEELRSGHTASQRGLLRRLLRPRGAIWLTTGSSHQLSGSAHSTTQITGSMRHGGRRGRMRRGRCQSNCKAVARWQRIKCATLPPALGGCSGVCEHCGQENCDGACLPRHIVERWGKMVTSWYSLQIARSGDVDDVRRFLNRFPDFKGVDNMFRAAIRFKHYALVEYFLDEVKIDVNVRNGSGMPACWFAAIFLNKSDGGAMLQYLINRGAIVDSVNNWGMTMVHLLATADPAQSLPMMRTLHTTHGIRLDTVDDYGSAPVHWAALNGHVETVKYLTEMCGCHAPRANWSAILNELSNLRLIRPEHKEAQRAWRVKGLGALAASATPLAVAVLHSHAQVAQWLMGYGAGHSVKCMRDKRALLFQDQCHDLRMVAKTWPELLPEVLNSFGSDVVKNSHFTAQDGRLERASEFFNIRSATASGGWVERIYDVKLLYGEPDIPASNTPLSILLDTHYAPVFDLPVVKLIIQLKWTLYGGSYYMWELMRYFGTVITFYMGFIWLGNSSAAHAEAIRIACWALTAYNLVFEEGRELLHSPSARAYFGSSWNRQSLVTYTLTLALAPLYYLPTSHSGFELDAPNGPPLAQRMMVAPAALALFLRALEHLAIWRSTSIYIAVIRNMLISTAWWGLLFAIFQLAFSVAFYALLKGEPGYGSLGSTIVTVFAMSTGQIDQPFSDDTALNAAASVLLILFVMLVAVLQLNLLIAMLTCSYESMMDKAPAQTLMHKAETLLKWEGGMHPRQRHRFYRIINPKPGTQRRIKLNKLFSGMSRSEVYVYNNEARVVEQKKGVVLTGHLQLLNRLDALCSRVDELLQQGVGHQQRGAAGQLQHQESKTLEEVAKDADTAARSRGSASTMLGIFRSGFAAPAAAAASETATGEESALVPTSLQQLPPPPPQPLQRPLQPSQQRPPQQQQQQQQQQQRRRPQGGSPRSLRLQLSSASSRSLAATSTSSLQISARDGGANGNAQHGDGAVKRSSAQGRAAVARHSSSSQRGGSRRVSTGEGSDVGGSSSGLLRHPMVSWLQWRGGGASGTSERSVSTEELNDWRQRAMESLARQESRRAAVRVQAAVRGHLQRQRLRAQMNGSKV